MARSKHHQRGTKQWNPSVLSGRDELPISAVASVASATECTGLEAQPAESDNAAASYTQLYGIHTQKPQGNIGKGNPNNDQGEIAFHRGREKGTNQTEGEMKNR